MACADVMNNEEELETHMWKKNRPAARPQAAAMPLGADTPELVREQFVRLGLYALGVTARVGLLAALLYFTLA